MRQRWNRLTVSSAHPLEETALHIAGSGRFPMDQEQTPKWCKVNESFA